jgi:cell division protein YceG involved in septum cleavage
MNSLKFIKTVVLVLTFLLIFGVISFLGIFYQKMNKTPKTQTVELNLPQDTEIKSVSGNNDFVYILTNNKIIIYNIKTQTVHTQINLY